jgi:hypothetical protein
MLKLKQLLLPAWIFLFLSCNQEGNRTYAIQDFNRSLQPHLIEIVSKGIVMDYDNSLRKMATDKELIKLGQSEHPILRASAFREMLDRKSFNHFDILVSHLDDTALVAIDAGEFGIWFRTVSDDILQEAGWKTQEAKDKTVEQVLAKHNYLRSAYFVLAQIEPQEKFYPFVKDMATRPRRLTDEGNELDFGDIEYALYGLAKFKKSDDVKIIKDKMMRYVWKLSEVSFRLMKEFPDTAYFDVLQAYHRRRFYRFSGNRPGGFSGFVADRASPEDFIQALVMQQNQKSAQLLDTMLHLLPLQKCMPDKENIIDEVILEIWEHPCPAYARLREKIKTKAAKILEGRISISIDRPEQLIDTTKEDIRW